MKRTAWSLSFVVMGVVLTLSSRAWAQDLGQKGVRAPQTQMQEIQQRIANLYVADFRSQVELNEDQFLKVGPLIRQFILQRFQAANERETINQQLDQLSSQSDASEEKVRQLSEAKARVDRNSGNRESKFLNEIRAELSLSPQQVARVLSFNRRFFDERLPGLLDRARGVTPARGQPQTPIRPNVDRPNVTRGNRNSLPPKSLPGGGTGDAFREKKAR